MSETLGPELRFFSEATNYLWFKILLVGLIVGMLWRGVRSRSAAIQVLIAFPIANGITDLLKRAAPDLRPCIDLSEWVFHGIGCGSPAGTASAHSANMAAVAFVFCYRMGWWGAPWAAIALITGLSRIYVGAHYPHQVVLGWICGIAGASAVCFAWDYIAKKRRSVSDNDELAKE
jgi:membrane-associated phospholipid phosphatase